MKTSSELASHVALPAMDNHALQAAGTGLLEVIVDHLAQNVRPANGNVMIEPMRTYRFALARSYFRNQNPDAGKRHLEDHLKSLILVYQNYGGDYGHYMRRLEFLTVAEEYARVGQRTDLLDCLGRYADMPVTQNYGQQGNHSASMMSALATLPEADRFDVLKKWTLPTTLRCRINR